jgi:hypothetical protein
MKDERRRIDQELSVIEQAMRNLEISYEQYFCGIEKREPMKDRETLARQMRQFANRRIIQTDLRFKYQNLATRFHSYSGYWDRILRLIEEGRYYRQKGNNGRPSAPPPLKSAEPAPATTSANNEVDNLYRDLLEARKACNLDGAAPPRAQVAAMLEKQKAQIQEKFGDRQVDFRVETRDGKPRIVVKAKK